MNRKDEQNNEEEFDPFILETSEEEKQTIRSMTGNKKIWNYFLNLIRDRNFQSHINYFKKYNLNKKGEPKKPDDFYERIAKLCRHFGLDEVMWSVALEKYILKNELPRENLSTSCIVLDRVEIGEDEYPDGYYEDEYDDDGPMKEPKKLNSWSYCYPVIIRINPYASQREIVDYIKKSYTRYIKPIQERYKDEEVNLGKIRKKKQSIQERNDFIYQNRRLPSKTIMRMLYDKYGPKSEMDQGYIGKIISMEKKKRKEV